MKAEELRIGNLVHDKGQVRRIDCLDIRDVFEGRLIIPFEPIPLSVIWLRGFGFTTETEWPEYGDTNFWSKELDASIDLEDYPMEDIFHYRVHERARRKHIKYVHELQNLHYALKGVELTIKP